jgi:hypothetical protein
MARLGPQIVIPHNRRLWDQDVNAALAAEEAKINKIREAVRASNPGDLVGKELTFPRGDGQARYMVVKQSPLTLSHIHVGDAWTVEDALIRGLRVSDVRDRVERQARLAALFGGGAP